MKATKEQRSKAMITNLKIYDLEESIKASGYPMREKLDNQPVTDTDIVRAIKLARLGNGHDQFLTGIRVAFDLTFTIKAWIEAERYRFLEFVSSQSTMHRIAKFDLGTQYSPYVDPRIIEVMQELKDTYNRTKSREDYLKLLYSNPCGFKLTARLTTNYRCLKNIYNQRHNHRLPEWQEFCKNIRKLPYMEDILSD